MVKTVMSTMTMAMAVADDVTSLLQVSAGVRQSQGQRILAAVAEKGKDTICVPAVAGDVAPVSGSFTSRMSQQAVVVAAGSVAGEAGSFCVAKQDVLLIQRTFGLNTARDFEAALGSKNNKATTTTTTMDYATFDFAGNLTKKVTVTAGDCPSVEAALVQAVEASVSDKKEEPAEKKLTADQLRVCGCRNFLKSTAEKPNLDAIVAAVEAAAPMLLQRNFDAALASKNTAKKTTTTTTTTTTKPAANSDLGPLVTMCTAASAGSWAAVAKEFNNPTRTTVLKSFNITGGWEQCDKSWVVQGACDEYVMAPAPTVAPTVAPTAAPTAAPTVAPTMAATVAPTVAPTVPATVAPTVPATVAPTVPATVAPTVAATVAPTVAATVAPTVAATAAPTVAATVAPTVAATVAPANCRAVQEGDVAEVDGFFCAVSDATDCVAENGTAALRGAVAPVDGIYCAN